MAKNETTSPKVARKASKILRSSKNKNIKSVAASALTQTKDKKKGKRG